MKTFAIGAIAFGIYMFLTACQTSKVGPDGTLFPESPDYVRGYSDGFQQGVAEGVLLTQPLP
jgi:hypothetical protein